MQTHQNCPMTFRVYLNSRFVVNALSFVFQIKLDPLKNIDLIRTAGTIGKLFQEIRGAEALKPVSSTVVSQNLRNVSSATNPKQWLCSYLPHSEGCFLFLRSWVTPNETIGPHFKMDVLGM